MAMPMINFSLIYGDYEKDHFYKELFLYKLVPYMLYSSFDKDGKPLDELKYANLAVSLKLQEMLLAQETSRERVRNYKINAINDVQPTQRSADYYDSYKKEYDYYNGLGGNEVLLNGITMRDILHFMQRKSEYIMAVHAIVKLYIKWCNEFEARLVEKEPSFAECYLKLRNLSDEYPYQTLAEKALEEGAWKEFKSSSHLIYGYVETLFQKGIITLQPEGNIVSFIKEVVSEKLCNISENSKHLHLILQNASIAQSVISYKRHSKSSKMFELWQLPLDELKKNFNIKI